MTRHVDTELPAKYRTECKGVVVVLQNGKVTRCLWRIYLLINFVNVIRSIFARIYSAVFALITPLRDYDHASKVRSCVALYSIKYSVIQVSFN
jgi:hypothetical protein